jgi:uncharacterized membrane protein YedE/YeeE
MGIVEFLSQPWPWYVAGPLIGLMVPLLLIFGKKVFGISSNLQHLCAAIAPRNIPLFNYDWKREGGWNLVFFLGIALGGFLAGVVFQNPAPVQISQATVSDLQALGVPHEEGLLPRALFSLSALLGWQGWVLMVLGGLLIGFGTRYAAGCTSGHAISGLSNLQLPSLIAVIGFFIGGLLVTHLVLPLILR